MNLRCWDTKRRFGLDLLHPVSRYIDGLRSATVVGRDGQSHPNPLFAEHDGKRRHPSLVTFGAIVGVPWQDVASAASLAGPGLELLSAEALESEGRWPLMTPSSVLDQPDDPFMIESTAVRSGRHPLSNDEVLPPDAATHNGVNGHEESLHDQHSLQPACTFRLEEPIPCTNAESCSCKLLDDEYQRAICQPPGGGPTGSTQYSGSASPSLRELEVLRAIGSSAVVGSACPKVIDAADPDHGYNPALRALGNRLRDTLE